MPFDDRLFVLLRRMPDEELDSLWFQGLRNEARENEFERRDRQSRIELICRDLRSSAGHSLANIARAAKGNGDHALPWKRVLIDVADKLKPGPRWSHFRMADGHTEEEIEVRILEYLDERTRAAWNRLSQEKQSELAADITSKLEAEHHHHSSRTSRAAALSVSRDALGAALGSGLLTGGGLALLASSTAGGLVGGMLGGLTTQVGLWLVLQFAGWTTGLKLALGGGLGAIGLGAIALPALGIGLGLGVMGPSYSKTIPTVVLILASNQIHELFEGAERDD